MYHSTLCVSHGNAFANAEAITAPALWVCQMVSTPAQADYSVKCPVATGISILANVSIDVKAHETSVSNRVLQRRLEKSTLRGETDRRIPKREFMTISPRFEKTSVPTGHELNFNFTRATGFRSIKNSYRPIATARKGE